MGSDRENTGPVCPAPLGLDSRRLEIQTREVLVLSFPLRGAEAPVPLTHAERDVVRRVLRGASNAQVARERGRSPRTVANQLASAFVKLGVGSRTELARRLSGVDLGEDDEAGA